MGLTPEEYLNTRGPSLLRFAVTLTGDRHAAEDLVQATLARALPRWRRISGADHPDRYMQKVLLSEFLQGRRRRASTEIVTDELPVCASAQDVAGTACDRDGVRTLLARLSPKARAVVVLRYYLDWDDDAIAAEVRLSPGSVRSCLSRSLAALRSAVEPPAPACPVERTLS